MSMLEVRHQSAFYEDAGHNPVLLALAMHAFARWLVDSYNASITDTTILLDMPPGGMAVTSGLKPRERQVCAGIAMGLSNRQIAQELVIAVSTAERHVANIFRKLDMRSRAAVAAWVASQLSNN